jgi:hypothetical protein
LKNQLYNIGLTLISLSFIACVISYWLLIFGIPIFSIGVILVILSNTTTTKKLLATILPIIFYLPTTYLFLIAYNYTTPKTFLIPANYDGAIRIVYEESCGTKYIKEDGRQILTFPQNGILVLNENVDEGFINNKYYLLNENGGRTEVPEYMIFEKTTKKTPYILVGGSGVMSGHEQEKEIKYSDFYLCNKDTTLTDNYKLIAKFDSLTWKSVTDCRKKK